MATKRNVPQKKLTLEVETSRNPGGFGGYFAGTVKKGKARIFVNVDAMAWAAAEHGERGDFKRMFIDTLAHEFIHALEDSFDLLFDEEAVEAAIEAVRRAEDFKIKQGAGR